MGIRAGRQFRGRPRKFLEGLVLDLLVHAEAEYSTAHNVRRSACPEPLEYLYEHFKRLSNRRRYNQAALPITLQEIEAYERLFCFELSVWERQTICRIDDVVYPAINGRISKRLKNGGIDQPAQIPAEDVQTAAQSFEARAKVWNERRNKEGKSNGR